MNPITINQDQRQTNQFNQIELTIEKKEEKEDNFIQQFISFIDKPKELTPDVFGQTINEIKNQNINPNQIIEKFSFSWTEDFLQECPNKTIELMLEETKSADSFYYNSTITKQLIDLNFSLLNFTNMDTIDKIINTAFDNLTNPNENNTLKCFDFLISVFSDDKEIKEQLKTVKEKMTGKQVQEPLQLVEKLVEQTLIQQVQIQKQEQEQKQQIQELIKEQKQEIKKLVLQKQMQQIRQVRIRQLKAQIRQPQAQIQELQIRQLKAQIQELQIRQPQAQNPGSLKKIINVISKILNPFKWFE